MYMLYRSDINSACVCPFEDWGKYMMSIEMASLGCVGTIDLSRPTGMSRYSVFLVIAHVKQALHICLIALFC